MPDRLASRTATKGGQKLVDMGDGRIVDFTGWDDDKIENFVRNEKPTQFEKERQSGKGFFGTFADKVGGMFNREPKSQGPLIPDRVDDPYVSGVKDLVQRSQRKLPPDLDTLSYRTAQTLGPRVGISPEASERASDVGDAGAVAAEAAVPLATMAATEGIARGIPAIRKGLAKAAYDPATGKLKFPTATELGQRVIAGPDPYAEGRPIQGPSQRVTQGPGPYRGKAPTPTSPTAPSPVVGTSTATPRGNAPLPPVPTTPESPMTLGARMTAARTAPASTSGVTRVPVPRSPMPGDPNLMGSVPRSELPDMAGRGVPGAADQQRLLGEPVIYTPPEGNPPGSFEQLQSKLTDRVSQPESPSLSQRTTMAPEDDLEMARRGASGRETIDEEVARREQESAQSAESQRQQWEQQQGQGQPPQSNLLAQRTARARASAIRAARPRQGQQP